MTPPGYFNRVAADAAGNWEQLKNPVLAGPWKQLFAQVQSPRHVLSELLQNADDAGAKSASVQVINNEFVFEHDGEDFTEEQFQSVCRFGYSNKRNLYTIGFRGVGFKSTFSLGNQVRIQTQTLDLLFERDRFTLPVWNKNATATSCTRITVPFADERRLKQLRMNLKEWATSPVSLLFFRNLQSLTVEKHQVRKDIISRGPVSGSQRIHLTGASTQELILIRSAEEAFPEEVVNEIRLERNADDLHLPPCSVELVLGLDGQQRLFVVLPSGTEVTANFSINAPFLQDPARQKIKEPEVSPCNRWLLDRAGALAGKTMAAWLEKGNLSVQRRADAYELLSPPLAEAADLTTSATKIVMDAMLAIIEDKPILLTAEGELAEIGECTGIPVALHEVWEPGELTGIFVKKGNQLLSEAVTHEACQALEAHGWIETINADGALQALNLQTAIPKPDPWIKLQILWEWVEQNRGWDWNGDRRRSLRIVPAQGLVRLQSGKDMIRISSRAQNISEEDWKFISSFALTVDKDWIEFLGKLKSKEPRQHQALALLQTLALHEPSQVDRIAAQASRRLLQSKNILLDDCVHMAHIFAALNAVVPDDFHYVSENRNIHLVKPASLIFDAQGHVEPLVPATWAKENLLHPDYVGKFSSCSKDRWFEWAYSPKSKLHAFVPIDLNSTQLYGRKTLATFLVSREANAPKEYRYKNDTFLINDLDFNPDILKHFQIHATGNPNLWPAVVKGLLFDPLLAWENSLAVQIYQVSAQGTTTLLDCGRVQPAWLVNLRSIACLTDTHGNIRTPSELLLRTPQTESLLGIEPFVAAELDDTPAKKKLLRLLGVRDTSTGWEKVVERLRLLTSVKDPMRVIGEVLRYYETLDRIILRCSSDDLLRLRTVFANEPLILSNSLTWLPSSVLCLHADPEDNSPIVHLSAQVLGLWLRVGVSERPAFEKSLEWLKTLAVGMRLEGGSYQHAKLALSRGGQRVWVELGRWLSLDQTWETVTSLKYRVSMRNLTSWDKLSPEVRRSTADLRMLQADSAEVPPFTLSLPLVEAVVMKATHWQPIPGKARSVVWQKPLAEGLSRIKFEDEKVKMKVREVALRLLKTEWQTVSTLEVTPHINGTPAGEPLFPRVFWAQNIIYLKDESTVRLFRDLKDALCQPFEEPSVMEAVAHCLDRNADFVKEYLEANFELELLVGPPVTDESEEANGKGKNGGNKEEGVSGSGKEEQLTENVKPDAGEEVGDSNGNGQPEGGAADVIPPKLVKPPPQQEPTFMERYARSRDFNWHETDRRYVHSNGEWITRGKPPFPWHECTSDGSLKKQLFVAEKSLANGVEIPAELWRLMEINPETIALVLCGDDGNPYEWSAVDLKELHEGGQVCLHQSQFILKEIQI